MAMKLLCILSVISTHSFMLTKGFPLGMNYGQQKLFHTLFLTNVKRASHPLTICKDEIQPHPAYANKYIRCASKTDRETQIKRSFYYIFECPTGSIFDEESKQCLFRSKTSTSTSTIPTTTTTTQTTGTGETTTTMGGACLRIRTRSAEEIDDDDDSDDYELICP